MASHPFHSFHRAVEAVSFLEGLRLLERLEIGFPGHWRLALAQLTTAVCEGTMLFSIELPPPRDRRPLQDHTVWTLVLLLALVAAAIYCLVTQSPQVTMPGFISAASLISLVSLA